MYLKRWLRLHIRNMQNNSVSIRCFPPYCLDWFQHLNYTFISRTHSAIAQCLWMLISFTRRYVFNIIWASEMIHLTNDAYITPWIAHKSLVMFVMYFRNQCRLHFSVIIFLAYICYGYGSGVFKLGYWEPQSGNSKNIFAYVFRRCMVLHMNKHTLALKIFYPTNCKLYL